MSFKKLAILSLFVLISIFAFSCKKDSNGTHTVRYTVQGSSKSTVTYTDQNGNVQTVTNADSNWETTFTSSKHGLVLKLTVTSNDNSLIGGKIFIDGTQSAQNNGSTSSISISSVLP
jgi:hypothetical protein